MSKEHFAKFYQQYLDKIYRFVLFRIGGRRELAEDLTSEIFLKALEHFESYSEEKSKAAWIFTIARNHLANYFRDTAKRVEVSLEEVDENLHLEVESQKEVKSILLDDGFEQLLKKDAERELWQALRMIEEEKRRFVTLKHLIGYNYKEIGEILEMSPGAVKVATHRAMKELKLKVQSKK